MVTCFVVNVLVPMISKCLLSKARCLMPCLWHKGDALPHLKKSKMVVPVVELSLSSHRYSQPRTEMFPLRLSRKG